MPDPTARRTQLTVEVDANTPGSSRLIVRGELDLAGTPALRRSVDDLLGDGVRELVVDLSRVTFCDLTGLNLLLLTDRRLTERGGRLEVRGEVTSLRIMLVALDLQHRLPLLPSSDTVPDGPGPWARSVGNRPEG